MEVLFITASNYVLTNRKSKEFNLFNSMYRDRMPTTCFLDVYIAGNDIQIGKYRDHVSFCTVVMCLEGDGEGGLTLTTETNEPHEAILKAKDIIVFARIDHEVFLTSRASNRVTLNAFF